MTRKVKSTKVRVPRKVKKELKKESNAQVS